MDRIFSLNTSIPNYITVLLSRPNDTHETYTGEMTISEILPEFQNISNQPNVPFPYFSPIYLPISISRYFWIPMESLVQTEMLSRQQVMLLYAPTHDQSQLQVIFDTGFSLPQLPE